MKIDNHDDDNCYGYMRLTHALAVCWGLPITRRRTKDERDGRNSSDYVRGHRYAFDWRVVPVWLAYAALDVFIIYYNYLEASGYVGVSFRKCFEESYCFAVIELANRNLGPFSALACAMFYGRRHKAAALAGTERTLVFIRDTDRDAAGGTSSTTTWLPWPLTVFRYYSAVMMVALALCIWLYVAAVPWTVILPYCVNALGQASIYNLAVFQYHVLGHGYARIDRLLEVAADAGRDRRSLASLVARLARASDDFGRQVGHLNRAYSQVLLLKWPYNVVRITMVVFRIMELSGTVMDGNPFARIAAVLIVEHVVEICLFLVQLSYFCYTGARLSGQANRTAASLQKLKIHHGSHLDLEVKKTINIFWIQLNTRKINATIGGFVIVNMDLMKAVSSKRILASDVSVLQTHNVTCGIITTYFLVLIQFKSQKDKSKPLYYIWN